MRLYFVVIVAAISFLLGFVASNNGSASASSVTHGIYCGQISKVKRVKRTRNYPEMTEAGKIVFDTTSYTTMEDSGKLSKIQDLQPQILYLPAVSGEPDEQESITLRTLKTAAGTGQVVCIATPLTENGINSNFPYRFTIDNHLTYALGRMAKDLHRTTD